MPVALIFLPLRYFVFLRENVFYCLFHYFSVIHASAFSFLQPQDVFMSSKRSLFFWGAVIAPLTSPGTRIWPVFLPLKEQAMYGLAGQWRQRLTLRIHVRFKTAQGTALRVSVLYALLLSLSWTPIYVSISGSVLHELNFHFPFFLFVVHSGSFPQFIHLFNH